MDKILYQNLKMDIDLSSRDALYNSIYKVMPYVSNTLLASPSVLYKKIRFYNNVKNRLSAYHEFLIPKKTGGTRKILAPNSDLKSLMSAIAFILNTMYMPSDSVMGFVKQRSVLTNAQKHVGNNYVFNIDLSDFFPSITDSMIEAQLLKMNIPPLATRIISSVCTYPQKMEGGTYRQVLPQGSPASPILSNICCISLDKALEGLAKRFHLTYSRYADDITFSSNHSVYQEDGEFMTELQKIIATHHFFINPKKTRLQKRGTRQEVTGVSVNEKTNVSRKYVKNLRALIHQIALAKKLSTKKVNVARGKLNYLRMIKGANDSTYKTLCIKLNLALKGKHFTPKKKRASVK